MAVHVYTAHRRQYAGRDRLDLTTCTQWSRAFPCDEQTVCPPGAEANRSVRERYLVCLRQSYRTRRGVWQRLLARARLVIVCACPPGQITCRRYVLADVLGILGARLGGEIRGTPMPRVPSARLRLS